MGIVTDAEAYIFPGTDREKPLAENTARNYFKRILEESGITRDGYLSNERGPCLHCFRHTFAIRSFKQAEMLVLWSSIFVTLVASKFVGLLLGVYWRCQIISRVFHTALRLRP
jgi:integrase